MTFRTPSPKTAAMSAPIVSRRATIGRVASKDAVSGARNGELGSPKDHAAWPGDGSAETGPGPKPAAMGGRSAQGACQPAPSQAAQRTVNSTIIARQACPLV